MEKYFYWLISGLFLLIQSSFGQVNLIPHGDFELSQQEHDQYLLLNGGYVDFLPGNHWLTWNGPINGVEVIVPYDNAEYQGPNTPFGYQEAQSGHSMGGMTYVDEVIRIKDSGNTYEYSHDLVGVRLKEDLIQDSLYYFEGYFSLGSNIDMPPYNCGRIDFAFHAESLKTSPLPINEPAEYYFYPDLDIISLSTAHFNTESWAKVSFVYKAKGGEKFLSFSQLWNDESDIYTCDYPPYVYTETDLATIGYYFFDNLSLTKGVPKLDLEIPNVFSPNHDGQNDAYGFFLEGVYEALSFKIYNRWGELVFEGNSMEDTWDGTHANGQECTEGVYFITVKAKERFGIWKEKSGYIHLMR